MRGRAGIDAPISGPTAGIYCIHLTSCGVRRCPRPEQWCSSRFTYALFGCRTDGSSFWRDCNRSAIVYMQVWAHVATWASPLRRKLSVTT